jgi:demethylmenaquinone methyltransferase/2-methoxy-6-polyprenyl-1,4-benzoquinol methylase
MFGSIAHRYDLTNSVLSLGIHHLWRRTLVRMLPEKSSGQVLDLCSGTGDLIPLLERRFGKAVGGDFCFPMMQNGRKKFASQNAVIPRFVQCDALSLPFPDASFDIISVAFGVRNLENLRRGLLEMRRVLKPGGHALILEFGQPRGIFFAPLFRFYSDWLMPLIGGFLTGNRRAYSYLPQTSKDFPCGAAFEKILGETGYSKVKAKTLTGGIAYAYCAERG